MLVLENFSQRLEWNQPVLERFVGVDCEIRRDHGKTRTVPNVGFEEFADAATVVVVPDARTFRRSGHGLRTGAQRAGRCLKD